MRLNYKFSNLLGCVYRKGNLDFSRDGSMKLYSPVGNRITVFDLKNNKSETLPCETNYNVECVAVSPNNTMMIVVDEIGSALFINLTSKVAIHSHDFRRKVSCVSFSPDGRRFAVAIDNSVVLYRTPGTTPEINPFVVDKRFKVMHDTVTCIDWSTDSRVMCVGSKDMNTYVICAELCANLSIKPMGGLKDVVVGCFFLKESLDFITMSELGELCVWSSDTKLSDLIPGRRNQVKNYGDGDDRGDVSEEDDEDEEDEDADETSAKKAKKNKIEKDESDETKKEVEKTKQVFYTRTAKHYYKNLLSDIKVIKKKDDDDMDKKDVNKVSGSTKIRMTACDYHKRKGILVTAFDSGVFYIHLMPNFELTQKLSLENQLVGSIRFDPLGECVAVACPKMGQLLVWEWMSEYCLMKQQGHFGITNCFDYSPDGLFMASGGEDGKVKLWDLTSGNCFVTFSEHSSSITGIAFKSTGQAFVTSSLDGTVRAFDMIRYRNFRTFTAPERTSTQFYSVALDYSGDIVCAGARDTFEIYVWSMKTGSLVNTLSGHEGPVGTLSFSIIDNILASGSWDHTVRLWSLHSKSGATDVISVSSDVLSICFRPDGQHIAVATLDGQITVFDVKTAIQLYCMEGQKDLGYSRKETDKITAKKSALGKSFKAISYTADGQYLLAGGQSKFICIYSVEDQLLLRKFEITCNLSLDGTQEFLDRRRMTEFGSLSLCDEDDFGARNKLSLPGVARGEFSGRAFKPEVRVNSVKFSPTGLSWIAATTEGILVYSLKTLIGDSFDPFELDLHVTPQRVDEMLERSKFREALILALRLNSRIVVQKVLESVPLKKNFETMDVDDDSDDEGISDGNATKPSDFKNQMAYICSSLPDKYIPLLVRYLAILLETSRHIELYATWSSTLLACQTFKMKQLSSLSLKAALIALERSLARVGRLVDIIEHNHYTLQFVLNQIDLMKIENHPTE